MHRGAGEVFAVGGLAGHPEVGQGFKEAVDARGFEAELAREGATADGFGAHGQCLEDGESVDQALVRLRWKHLGSGMVTCRFQSE